MPNRTTFPELTLEEGPELYLEGGGRPLKRSGAFGQLMDLGTCYARCSCGHVAKLNLIEREHTTAPIGAVARALRCQWCGFKSNPWIVVRMKPRPAYVPRRAKRPHRDSPQAVSFWERYAKESRAPEGDGG
jgi:hypothetical protein